MSGTPSYFENSLRYNQENRRQRITHSSPCCDFVLNGTCQANLLVEVTLPYNISKIYAEMKRLMVPFLRAFVSHTPAHHKSTGLHFVCFHIHTTLEQHSFHAWLKKTHWKQISKKNKHQNNPFVLRELWVCEAAACSWGLLPHSSLWHLPAGGKPRLAVPVDPTPCPENSPHPINPLLAVCQDWTKKRWGRQQTGH